MRSILFLLLQVVSIQLTAQVLNGVVVNDKDEAIPFVNIAVLSVSDSTLLGGTTTNETGKFSIDCKSVPCILRFSSIGYTTFYKNYNGEPTATINLVEDSKLLGEVVVKGKQRIYRMTAEGLSATIQGSALSKLPELSDVLNQLPFLNVSNGVISVLGKGSPLIYLDGRKITDNTELKGLKGNQIKNVEVIMNPGSCYASNVGAVIRITTIRNQGDGWSGLFQWSGIQTHRFAQEDFAKFNYRKNGFDVFASTYYRESRNEGDQTNKMLLSYLDKTIAVNSTVAMKSTAKYIVPVVGINYASNDNSLYAGMKYFYSRTIKMPYTSNGELRSSDLEGDHIMNTFYFQNNYGGQHNVTGYFLKTFKNKWQIEANVSYAELNLITDLSTTEMEQNRNVIVGSQNDRKSNVYAENIMLSKPSSIGKFTFGEEYIYSNSKQKFDLTDDAHVTILSSNNNQTIQNSIALFGQYNKQWKHWSTNVGLRYEWVNFNYKLNNIKQAEQSKKYSSLLPTLSLSYSKEQFGATLSFRSTIMRPPYSVLRSSTSYNDRYTYERGDPSLRPCYKYDLGLLLRYKDFVMSANYVYLKDGISFYKALIDNQPIALSTHINTDYSSLRVQATYSSTFGIWKPTVTLGGYVQHLNYKGMSYTKPLLIYAFKNMLSFSKSFFATFNLVGKSAGNDELVYRYSNLNTSVSVVKDFPCGLQLSFIISDIFNTSREYWSANSPGLSFTKCLKGTVQAFYVTLRYSFNTASNKYRGKGAGNDEIKRL